MSERTHVLILLAKAGTCWKNSVRAQAPNARVFPAIQARLTEERVVGVKRLQRDEPLFELLLGVEVPVRSSRAHDEFELSVRGFGK
ncbi:MAG TPA: hypothetical protein VEW46_16365 [Pyrinomonadaceae bacterium]|nr:hypothetical protein [Pyrinomonadaceae bacterium]